MATNLSKLLQLTSTLLPVGAYSYSQGLEWAVESGDVTDLASVQQWICDVLETYYANFELPILLRLARAWQSHDIETIQEWDAQFKAGRDSAESLLETLQTGYSLRRLIQDLGEFPADFLHHVAALDNPSFPALYAGLAVIWNISEADMLHAYAWSWAENQASAAMKTVPLGQVSGQKILLCIGAKLPAVVEKIMALPDADICNFTPYLSICASRHEIQYTRLFRS